ncbi:enolase C-terminal domain-like protein, partial [Rhizobium johnstonii]
IALQFPIGLNIVDPVYGGGMLIEAIAGVDIALWDVMGKAAGMPIAKLLGGIGRETIEVYAAAVNWVDDVEADRELERYIGEGFPRIKVKMANPVREACRRIERLRKRAGDDIELCVDANWAYDLDQAIEVDRPRGPSSADGSRVDLHPTRQCCPGQ